MQPGHQPQLMTRSEFARLILRGPSVVTDDSMDGRPLAAARVGKRIDAAHPDAVAYRRRRAITLPADTDPLFEQAVEFCYRTGKFGRAALRVEFGIGDSRAGKLLGRMDEIKPRPPIERRRPRMSPPPLPPREGAEPAPLPPPPLQAAPPRPAPPSAPAAAAAPPRTHQAAAGAPYLRGQAKARATAKWGDVPAMGEVPENIAEFADLTIREVIERFGTDTRFLDYLKSVKELENIAALRIKNAKAQGELISRALVAATVLDPINSAHIQLLTDGARTIAVRAKAMAASGATAEELETFVSQRVGSFIRPVKERVQRALECA